MLCALLVSAIAAQDAAAASTTAYTCKVPGVGDSVMGTNKFEREHCAHGDINQQTGTYRHVDFGSTTTELTVSNTKTGTETEASFLHSVQSGIEEELKATGVHGTGSLMNKTTGGGEMYVHAEGVLTFTGVSVIKPAGKGCAVAGGEVVTNQLTATTEGLTEAVKISPAPEAGGVFATFTIEGCSLGALNGVYEVKGSVTSSSIDGATIKFERTPTTSLGTLKVRGQNAGLAGLLTPKGRDPLIVGDSYKPLSPT
jgi:hypothetical protein